MAERALKIKKQRIGDRLLEAGVITEEQLAMALQRQQQSLAFLGDTLVQLGFISSSKLGPFLAEVTGFPFVDLASISVPDELSRLLSENYMRRKRVLPFARANGAISVAMADPLNITALDEMRSLGVKLEPHLALNADLDDAFKRVFNAQRRTAPVLEQILDADEDYIPVAKLADLAADAPIVKLMRGIISGAITSGASDIHIEPSEEEVRVRFRIDGLLYEEMSIPVQHLQAAISRLKIMSNLDIAERRRPQDGRFGMTDELGREYELRLSIMPTIYGEKAVMRILEKANSLGSLEKLGFFDEQFQMFSQFISRPHGIVLVTGPTGSGKSTTLYGGLQKINQSTLNINTIEDPVEYKLKGVNQVQVNPKIGVTFANGLRTLVRQDPDVILVGEIRDAETAEISVQAALTGHLVLSSLHTNDAPGALVRLQNMGVEPFLLSSAVIGIVAQRLLRTICPHCKTTFEATPEILKALDMDVPEDAKITFARGAGCSRCNNRGTRGRTAVYEVMAMSETLREMVLRREASAELMKQAIEEGMQTMRQSGIKKVCSHLVSPEEALRVLAMEDL